MLIRLSSAQLRFRRGGLRPVCCVSVQEPVCFPFRSLTWPVLVGLPADISPAIRSSLQPTRRPPRFFSSSSSLCMQVLPSLSRCCSSHMPRLWLRILLRSLAVHLIPWATPRVETDICSCSRLGQRKVVDYSVSFKESLLPTNDPACSSHAEFPNINH